MIKTWSRLILLMTLLLPATAAAGPCGNVFEKAATLKRKPLPIKADGLACRSLGDGPKGYRLQCLGKPLPGAKVREVARRWSRCLEGGGFGQAERGHGESIRITEFRHVGRRIVCTMIRKATDEGAETWRIKMTCYGPR
jgi:hypothetical protein